MISMLSGKLTEKAEGEALLMTPSGIGFSVSCSTNTLSLLPPVGNDCTLYTHLSVREDAMELYGFADKEERSLFRRLISVSGVGAKTALMILSSMTLSDLRMAILTGDSTALSRAPGVGKKTAQRISLELKDKLSSEILNGSGEGNTAAVAAAVSAEAGSDAFSEAMLALKSLGYTPQESANALKGIKGKADTADEMIRLALRHMAQNA